MKKSAFFLGLCLLAVLLLLPNAAWADTAADYAWDLTDGVLTISGNGDMPSYNTSYRPPWYADRGSIVRVKVQPGITTIGTYAFKDCTNITSVSLPSGLTLIDEQAFSYCQSLQSIALPGTLRTIKHYAFEGTGLTQIEFSFGLNTIWHHAFYNCPKLKSVVLPGSLQTLYCTAFEGCKALTSIEIPASLTSVPRQSNTASYSTYLNSPFYNTGLTQVTFESGTTKIPDNLFLNCGQLEEITLPNTVTSIGVMSFSGCPKLCDVRLSTKLTEIGREAFSYCPSLERITIPDTVRTIREYAFVGCTGLTHVDLPFGLETLWHHAFYNCTNLKTVVLPDSLKTLYCTAFEGCKALTSIEIPASLTSVPRQSNTASYYTYLNGPFCNSGLTEFSFREGCVTIAPYLFEGCPFEELSIPEGITTIGDGAFANCKKLTELDFSDTVTTVRNGAFSGCPALTIVNMADSVTSLGMYVFQGCSALTDVTMSQNLSSIGAQCFNRCTELQSIWIPASLHTVTYAGNNQYDGPFNGSGLESFEMEKGSAVIPARLFYGAANLTEITVPASVTSVGDIAFQGCSRLSRVKFGGDAPAISGSAFSGVTANAYYPQGNGTWTEDVQKNYGGTLTWYSYIKVDAPVITGELVDGYPVIKWDAVPRAASYEVYRSNFPQRAYFKYKTTADTSYTNNTRIEDYRTYYYKILALDEDGNTSEYSNIVSVTIIPADASAPKITVQPYSTVAEDGGKLSFTITAEGGGLSFQWYSKAPTASEWSKITSARSDTCSLTASKANAGFRYRCEVSNIIGSLFSDEAVLIMTGAPDFVLPSALTAIEREAFTGGAFRYVQAGNALTAIGSKAFAGCPNLLYIALPQTVETIAKDAFGSADTLTIIGVRGSYAESFAKENGFSFAVK